MPRSFGFRCQDRLRTFLIIGIAGALWWPWTPGAASTREGKAAGNGCAGYVALTFDDGPHWSNTTRLLAKLKAEGVRATMFNIGVNVQYYPEMTKAQVKAGMWIGNHTWSHPRMKWINEEDLTREISSTQEVIKRTTGITPRLFQAPYNEVNDTVKLVTRRLGLTLVRWTVDSLDWHGASTEEIVRSADSLKAGGIILLHDNRSATVDAIPQIIENVKAKGLCFGAISPDTGGVVAP